MLTFCLRFTTVHSVIVQENILLFYLNFELERSVMRDKHFKFSTYNIVLTFCLRFLTVLPVLKRFEFISLKCCRDSLK